MASSRCRMSSQAAATGHFPTIDEVYCTMQWHKHAPSVTDVLGVQLHDQQLSADLAIRACVIDAQFPCDPPSLVPAPPSIAGACIQL